MHTYHWHDAIVIQYNVWDARRGRHAFRYGRELPHTLSDGGRGRSHTPDVFSAVLSHAEVGR